MQQSLVYVCEYQKDRQFNYGSHGVSLRLMKGVSYRVGGTGRGHIISNDILVKTGGGALLITNKRVVLIDWM